MSQNDITLAHMFDTVPQLLPAVLSYWEQWPLQWSSASCKYIKVGIRVLRLVNKETYRAALRAVHSCSLQVGQGAKPDPHQVVQVLQHASLEEMRMTVLLNAGVKCVVSAKASAFASKS